MVSPEVVAAAVPATPAGGGTRTLATRFKSLPLHYQSALGQRQKVLVQARLPALQRQWLLLLALDIGC
jgi:hypothetical protein